VETFPVIGVTPGIIGMIQATEVLKYLLDKGELLTDRLFIWDGLQSRAEEIRMERNPRCHACSSVCEMPGDIS
jgi:adenylyltransferase/sulfurtransferase